jgi:fatty acyl-CoA reductase
LRGKQQLLALKSLKAILFQLFDRLKNERPDYKSRVIAIVGDCVQEDLGLTPEDREELISKTNIVFHVAATVNFNENIKTAYDINVKGTKVLLDFCKKFKILMVAFGNSVKPFLRFFSVGGAHFYGVCLLSPRLSR